MLFVLCWLKWSGYLRHVSPTWGIFWAFIQSMWMFLWCLPYKLANGLHGEPQKEKSNWCDWLGVRVHNVMKWHGLYQSVSHSVTAVVPEYWLPLRPALLHTAVALPLGNSHSFPSCLWFPFAPSPAFISTLQAVPFQSIISSPPTLALREGAKEGSMLRGVEFFYRSWHPWRSVTRHFALSFTLFFPLSTLCVCLSLFKLPSSTSFSKATQVFPANLFFSSFLVFSLVCPCTLLLSNWSSISGGESLKTLAMNAKDWDEEKTLGFQSVCSPFFACVLEKWKIQLGRHNRGCD